MLHFTQLCGISIFCSQILLQTNLFSIEKFVNYKSEKSLLSLIQLFANYCQQLFSNFLYNSAGLTPEQINLIAFLFFSQIMRYNKYFKNTKVGCFRSKRFLGISNKAVYEGRTVLEGNCPKQIPQKIFFHVKHPTFTNTYIYIRLLRCKTNWVVVYYCFKMYCTCYSAYCPIHCWNAET